ncbi:MAG: AMP-dependent synthetase, partial [Acidobacteriota bacterium]
GRVSPREIENVLYEMPEVEETAVIGVDHEILGQAVKAFVVVKMGSILTKDAVLKHCAEQLENYMVPKFVEFRESLPKSSHGKIDKKELQ